MRFLFTLTLYISLIHQTYTQSRDTAEQIRQKGLEAKQEGALDSAHTFYQIALDMFKQQKDTLGLLKTTNNLGLLYMTKGDYVQAISCLQIASTLAKSGGYVDREQMVTLNLASLYAQLGDHQNAYFTFKRLIGIAQNDKRRTRALIGIANIYATEDYINYNSDSAIYYYSHALHNAMIQDDSVTMSQVYNNLGRVYAQQGNHLMALNNYQKTLTLAISQNDLAAQLTCYHNLGRLFLRTNNLSEALKYLQLAENLAIKLSDPQLHIHILANMVDTYMGMNMLKQASDKFEKYKLVKDSLYSEERSQQINELKVIHETNEKEQLLRKEIRAKQQEQKTNRQLTLLSILLLISLIYIVFIFQRKRKADRLKAEKEQEVISLKAKIEGIDTERNRIGKDLHDGLGSLLTSIKMIHSQYVTEPNSAQGQKIGELLDMAGNTVRNVAHDLSSVGISRFGLVKAVEDQLSSFESASHIETSFYTNLNGHIVPEAIARTLDFCLRELLNNALKYSAAESISVQLLKNEKDLMMVYEDDGKGFKKDNVKYGLGLQSIQERVASVNGQVEIESEPDEGLWCSLSIPIK